MNSITIVRYLGLSMSGILNIHNLTGVRTDLEFRRQILCNLYLFYTRIVLIKNKT